MQASSCSKRKRNNSETENKNDQKFQESKKLKIQTENYEYWAPCIESDIYEVSNLGKVRNKNTKKELLQRTILKGGQKHPTVGIVIDSIKGNRKQVGDLVAHAFHIVPENEDQVLVYADNDSTNCKLENLSYQNMDNEIWEVHPIFDNYKISKSGKVKNKLTNKLLSERENSGYLSVDLYKNGKKYAKMVHRLVLETYSPNENDDNLQVDHISRNRKDNRFENLRWVTATQNNNNKEKKPLGSQAGLKVKITNLSTNETKIFNSLTDAGRFFKKHRATLVKAICKNILIDNYSIEYYEEFQITGKIREIRKDILVSSCGFIKRKHLSWTRGTKTRNGYYVISIMGNQVFVHVLIAEAFYGPKPSKNTVVNHINLNKGDNNINNLEYITNQENIQHAIDNRPSRRQSIVQFENFVPIRKFVSVMHAVYYLTNVLQRNINRHSISNCCKNQINSAYGFQWKYTENVTENIDHLPLYDKSKL